MSVPPTNPPTCTCESPSGTIRCTNCGLPSPVVREALARLATPSRKDEEDERVARAIFDRLPWRGSDLDEIVEIVRELGLRMGQDLDERWRSGMGRAERIVRDEAGALLVRSKYNTTPATEALFRAADKIADETFGRRPKECSCNFTGRGWCDVHRVEPRTSDPRVEAKSYESTCDGAPADTHSDHGEGEGVGAEREGSGAQYGGGQDSDRPGRARAPEAGGGASGQRRISGAGGGDRPDRARVRSEVEPGPATANDTSEPKSTTGHVPVIPKEHTANPSRDRAALLALEHAVETAETLEIAQADVRRIMSGQLRANEEPPMAEGKDCAVHPCEHDLDAQFRAGRERGLQDALAECDRLARRYLRPHGDFEAGAQKCADAIGALATPPGREAT